LLIYFNDQSISTVLPITNKCNGSLKFRMINYLALLVTLLIRLVCPLNQMLLICLCSCVAGYLTTFERETACAIYRFQLNFTCIRKISHVTSMIFVNTCNNRNSL